MGEIDILPETIRPGSDTGISYLAVTLNRSAWIWGLKEWKPLWRLPRLNPHLLFPDARYCVYNHRHELEVVVPQTGETHRWGCKEQNYAIFVRQVFYMPDNKLLAVFDKEVYEMVAQIFTMDGNLVKDIRDRYGGAMVAAFSPISMYLLIVAGVWATWYDVNEGKRLGYLNTHSEYGHCIDAAQLSGDIAGSKPHIWTV